LERLNESGISLSNGSQIKSNNDLIENSGPLSSDHKVPKGDSIKNSGQNQNQEEKNPQLNHEKKRRINPMRTQGSLMSRPTDFFKRNTENTIGTDRLPKVMATHISHRQDTLAQDLIWEHEASSYLLKKKMPTYNLIGPNITKRNLDFVAADTSLSRKRSLGAQNRSLNPDLTLGHNSIDGDSWHGRSSIRREKNNFDALYGTSPPKENLVVSPVGTVTPFRVKTAEIRPPDSKHSPLKKKSEGKSSDNKKEGSSSYRGWVSATMLRFNGAKFSNKLGAASNKESILETYGANQTQTVMKNYCSSV
jgi:hypothetical protein